VKHVKKNANEHEHEHEHEHERGAEHGRAQIPQYRRSANTPSPRTQRTFPVNIERLCRGMPSAGAAAAKAGARRAARLEAATAPRAAFVPNAGSLLAETRKRFQAASYSAGGQDWSRLFRHYDRDNSGELDWDEFRRAVRKDANVTANVVTDAELRQLFTACDTDGGGTIVRPHALLHITRPCQLSGGRHRASRSSQLCSAGRRCWEDRYRRSRPLGSRRRSLRARSCGMGPAAAGQPPHTPGSSRPARWGGGGGAPGRGGGRQRRWPAPPLPPP
jgi:hypothetical protein